MGETMLSNKEITEQEIISASSYLRIKIKEYDLNIVFKKLSIFGVLFPLPLMALSENISMIPPHPSIVISIIFAFLYRFYDKKQKTITEQVLQRFSPLMEKNEKECQSNYLAEYFNKLTPKKKKEFEIATKLFLTPRLMRTKNNQGIIEEALEALAVEHIKIKVGKEKSF